MVELLRPNTLLSRVKAPLSYSALCDCDTEVEFKARVIVIEFRRGGDISIEDDVEADVLGETTRKVYCSRCKSGIGQLAEVFYAKTIVIGRGNAESSGTL